MVRGPRFELGTPIFSAGCLKWRRGHKSLRHNVGSSPHSCKSFTALHRVARGNVYRIRIGEGSSGELAYLGMDQILITRLVLTGRKTLAIKTVLRWICPTIKYSWGGDL